VLGPGGNPVRVLAGTSYFSLLTAFTSALRPNQPPLKWALEAISIGVKPPGRESDHSHLVTGLLMLGAASIPTSVIMSWPLIRHSEKFTILSGNGLKLFRPKRKLLNNNLPRNLVAYGETEILRFLMLE
jgi:hypothetical protein